MAVHDTMTHMKRIGFVAVMLFLSLWSVPARAQEAPQNVPMRAVVQEITGTYADDNGRPQETFTALGADGNVYRLDTRESLGSGIHYALGPGDAVSLQLLLNEDGTRTAYFNDVVRTSPLLIIGLLFAVVTIAVGLARGILALVGLLLTVAVLFGVVIPLILAGYDAVLVTVSACVALLGINMHLTHGWKRQTMTAFASTVAGLALAWLFGAWAVGFARLSGLTSEEASILYAEHLSAGVNTAGILLAGILLGTTGALDDVAISQGEVVAELRDANPNLTRKELFVRAMRVGRHHIASIANTLVLAYAGASLPMFLLFRSTAGLSFGGFISTEDISEEIVRTLAGTIALVLTVPISTWFAVSFDKPRQAGYDGSHPSPRHHH